MLPRSIMNRTWHATYVHAELQTACSLQATCHVAWALHTYLMHTMRMRMQALSAEAERMQGQLAEAQHAAQVAAVEVRMQQDMLASAANDKESLQKQAAQAVVLQKEVGRQGVTGSSGVESLLESKSNSWVGHVALRPAQSPGVAHPVWRSLPFSPCQTVYYKVYKGAVKSMSSLQTKSALH